METQLNKWEELFASFLDLIEFKLKKGKDSESKDCYHLIDLTGANLRDIRSEEFYSASEILDRVEIYEEDYIIDDLKHILDNRKIPYDKNDFDYWPNLLKYRDDLPGCDNFFDFIDMMCDHFDDIDINKVYDKYYSDSQE